MSVLVGRRADPAAPLLTYYDDETGERTELSAITLDNWVAKTANLLVDGCGLGPGDRAAVLLPPHWQTAAVLLGCWSAGVMVGDDPAGADVVFATADRLAGLPAAGDVFGLALAPMAAPMRPGPPPGVADYVVEVRGHGDHFAGGPADPSLSERGAARARSLGLDTGARVLVDAATIVDPVDWLLAPLAVGGSIVLCGHLDRAKLADRIAAERVTLSLA